MICKYRFKHLLETDAVVEKKFTEYVLQEE